VTSPLRFPNQHGAWAFLVIPSIITAFLGGGSWYGLLFSLTWVCAFPVSYFLTSAFVARMRKKRWTSRAKRELQSAAPWGFLTVLGSALIVQSRAWILLEALVLVFVWSASVYLSLIGRERGVTNDLLLVALASTAPIFMYQISKNEESLSAIPNKIWIVCIISFLFFTGSVLHVKALIREAKSRKWHLISIWFHLLVTIGLIFFVPAVAIAFFIGLLRTLFMRPGLRPSKIGAVEAAVGSALILCTVISQR